MHTYITYITYIHTYIHDIHYIHYIQYLPTFNAKWSNRNREKNQKRGWCGMEINSPSLSHIHFPIALSPLSRRNVRDQGQRRTRFERLYERAYNKWCASSSCVFLLLTLCFVWYSGKDNLCRRHRWFWFAHRATHDVDGGSDREGFDGVCYWP